MCLIGLSCLRVLHVEVVQIEKLPLVSITVRAADLQKLKLRQISLSDLPFVASPRVLQLENCTLTDIEVVQALRKSGNTRLHWDTCD